MSTQPKPSTTRSTPASPCARSCRPRSIARRSSSSLKLSARSASGSNIQPWRIRVIAGDIKERLTKAIFDAVARDGFEPYQREWNYYPVNWREPFLGRRRKIGWDMYSLLGVAKGDFEGTQRARMRNYEFFGAPVGMIFTLDEDLEIGSWLDLGIYLGTLMVAARGHGLHTCPQAAFADFHKIIRPICSTFRRRKSSCAAWRSVTSIRMRRSIASSTERAPLADYASFEGL